MSWIEQLPNTNPPTWLGLPVTAENQLQSMQGTTLLSHLSITQGEYGEEGLEDELTGRQPSTGGINSKLSALLETVDGWIGAMPHAKSLPIAGDELTSDAGASPIQRSLAREITCGLSALEQITEDLAVVRSVLAMFAQ